MPPNHQQYLLWDGDRFRSWAANIGKNAAIVVKSILSTYKVEQPWRFGFAELPPPKAGRQGYRACMALLKMADQYTPERLDAACAKALFYTPRPGYKAIQTILKSGQDMTKPADEPPTSPLPDHGFTRGADYYGKGRS